MGQPDDTGVTFGARFLAEARRLTGLTLFDYAAAQRLKAMDQTELLRFLRENTGASYAQLQDFKAHADPEALAHFMLAERRRAETLILLALLI